MDHLAAVYPQYYFPSRYLSIDEMLVGTRCRVVFLQYLPKKPTKFGIKVWINSEAKSGYVLNFQIYAHHGFLKKWLLYPVAFVSKHHIAFMLQRNGSAYSSIVL